MRFRTAPPPGGRRTARSGLDEPAPPVRLAARRLAAAALAAVWLASIPLASIGLAAIPAAAQPDGATASAPAPATTTAAAPPATSGGEGGELSDAEILIRAQAMLAQDRERLRELQERRDELARAFEEASAAFGRLDAEHKQARAPAPDASAAAPPEATTAPAPTPPAPGAVEREPLEERWKRAREQVDLLLRRRQTVDQEIQILEAKRAKLQETIDFLTLGPQAMPDTGTGASEKAVAGEKAAAAQAAPPARPAEKARSPLPTPGRAAPSPPDASTAPAAAPPAAQTPPVREVFDHRVADALFDLDERSQELRAAEHRARLVKDLTSLNQQDLTLAQAAAEASRLQQALGEQEVQQLADELARQRAAEAPAREIAGFERRLAQARRRAEETTAAAEENAARVAALEARLGAIQTLRTTVGERLEAAEDRVEAARRRVEFVQSPLAPHRLLRWAMEAGPRIALILAVLAGLWALSRRIVRRMTHGMVSRSRYGSEEERLERVETLRRVFQSALTLGLLVIAALALLPQFGIDATVLLGGAAVLSVAIAFGAQNLVADYFSGFMILVEDQYRVGNVIQINDVSGVVEDVSLRMTTLRDIEGVAHFVPHSRIQSVSNLTHGWSRVALDVGVAYREDVDRVMAVLLELARELRKDPEFGPLIVDDPEMLGVDAFGDSAVVIKLLVRTRPLKQWLVKRELLRRIKNRFDELGIEIPFPHRTVYHRDGGGEPRAERPGASGRDGTDEADRMG